MQPRRVGIIGFGSLGQHILSQMIHHPPTSQQLEIAFVWNRDQDSLRQQIRQNFPEISERIIIDDLAKIDQRQVDLIIEVAHPDITRRWGQHFLQCADYMIGSPTALNNDQLKKTLLKKSKQTGHSIFVPMGAMIGLQDILLAAKTDRIASMTITMEKSPDSIKYHGPNLTSTLSTLKERTTLYQGPVASLCDYAPNNVNTMAVATLASGLDFSTVQAKLIADPSLLSHNITIEVRGPVPTQPQNAQFRLSFHKENPATPGAVTGSATYDSFVASVVGAHNQGPGLIFC